MQRQNLRESISDLRVEISDLLNKRDEVGLKKLSRAYISKPEIFLTALCKLLHPSFMISTPYAKNMFTLLVMLGTEKLSQVNIDLLMNIESIDIAGDVAWFVGFTGNEALSNLLIKDNPNWLVPTLIGFSQGHHEKHIEYIDSIINQIKSNLRYMASATITAAMSKDNLLVDKLLINDANINDALFGSFITPECVAQTINDYITRGASLEYAIQYAREIERNFQSKDHAVAFLASIESDPLRGSFANIRANKQNQDPATLLLEANKLRARQIRYGITPEQAQSWTLSMHELASMSIQIMGTLPLPPELFMHISTYVLDIPSQLTISLFDAHHSAIMEPLPKNTNAQTSANLGMFAQTTQDESEAKNNLDKPPVSPRSK